MLLKVFAHIAQSVEHFLGKEEVTGSNPVMSSSVVSAGSGLRRFLFGCDFIVSVWLIGFI